MHEKSTFTLSTLSVFSDFFTWVSLTHCHFTFRCTLNIQYTKHLGKYHKKRLYLTRFINVFLFTFVRASVNSNTQ